MLGFITFQLLFSSFLHQDTQKAKQFLPFLQRAGRSEAVVEYVFSGSRLKLYLPKETCLITFLLAGKSYVLHVTLSSEVIPGGHIPSFPTVFWVGPRAHQYAFPLWLGYANTVSRSDPPVTADPALHPLSAPRFYQAQDVGVEQLESTQPL